MRCNEYRLWMWTRRAEFEFTTLISRKNQWKRYDIISSPLSYGLNNSAHWVLCSGFCVLGSISLGGNQCTVERYDNLLRTEPLLCQSWMEKKDIIPKPYISHGPYLTNNTYSLIFIQLYVQYAGVDSVLTVSSLEAPP